MHHRQRWAESAYAQNCSKLCQSSRNTHYCFHGVKLQTWNMSVTDQIARWLFWHAERVATARARRRTQRSLIDVFQIMLEQWRCGRRERPRAKFPFRTHNTYANTPLSGAQILIPIHRNHISFKSAFLHPCGKYEHTHTGILSRATLFRAGF